MGNAINALRMAVGLLLAIAVIGFALFIFGIGKQLFQKQETAMQSLDSSISAGQWVAYDNKDHNGSGVLNAIRLHAETGEMPVIVDTLASSSSVTYNSSNKYTINDSTNENYINPAGRFRSSINRNANSVVVSITFTQQP